MKKFPSRREICSTASTLLAGAISGQTKGDQAFVKSRSVDGFNVSGNKLIDPHGRQFIVRGIASPYGPFCGGVKDWDSINTIERDYSIIKELGCNLVRICVAYKATSAEADRKKLVHVVAKAREKGFAVEIANSYTSFTVNTKTAVGDQPSWLAWLANRWKDDPYVWLVPINEPNGAPPGNRAKLNDWSFWQEEQNQYIEIIRKAGNTAPLIINTPVWSWDFSGIDKYPLKDPLKKIIYAAHRYANENKSFTDEQETNCDKSWASLAARYPIVVDEVGGQNSPYEIHSEWNRGFVSYCADWVNDKQGCGVVAFNWYWCDDNSMSGDWRRNRNTGELNEWDGSFATTISSA